MNKSKRIIGIVGSPRVGGNTDLLVEAALDGASESGYTTEKINLAKEDIFPCIACGSCKTKGKCFRKDDMEKLVLKMEEADVLVLGTPVYWGGPTAQFKIFFDRIHGIQDKSIFREKEVLLLVPFESKNPSSARHTVGMIKDSLEYLGVKKIDSYIFPGVVEKEDIKKDDSLFRVFEIGKSLEEKSELCCVN